MGVTATVENGIGRVVLDLPPLNILTRAALAELREALARCAAEPQLRVLVLGAAGKHFSAGADVGEHLPPHHLTLIPEFLETVAVLDAFPLPVIAAVRGKCLGGGFELVQAADMIVAGEGAAFGQPEIALGVFPPAAAVSPARASPAGARRESDLLGRSDPGGRVRTRRPGDSARPRRSGGRGGRRAGAAHRAAQRRGAAPGEARPAGSRHGRPADGAAAGGAGLPARADGDPRRRRRVARLHREA